MLGAVISTLSACCSLLATLPAETWFSNTAVTTVYQTCPKKCKFTFRLDTPSELDLDPNVDAGAQAAGRTLKPITFVRHTGFGDCELIVQLKATHMGDDRPPASAQDIQLVCYNYKSCNTTMSLCTYTTVPEQVQRYGLHLIDTATKDTQMQCNCHALLLFRLLAAHAAMEACVLHGCS